MKSAREIAKELVTTFNQEIYSLEAEISITKKAILKAQYEAMMETAKIAKKYEIIGNIAENRNLTSCARNIEDEIRKAAEKLKGKE